MPRVVFDKDFTWKARRGVRIAYKAGREYPVVTRCWKDAHAAGAVTAEPTWPTLRSRRGNHVRR